MKCTYTRKYIFIYSSSVQCVYQIRDTIDIYMYSPRKRLYILLLSKVYIWTKVNKIENKDEYTLIFSLFPYFLLFPSLQCTLDYMYVP